MILVEITIDGATKRCSFEPDDIPLLFLEAMDEAKWKEVRLSLAGMLGLTEEESRALTVRNLKQIGQGIKDSVTIPKAT